MRCDDPAVPWCDGLVVDPSDASIARRETDELNGGIDNMDVVLVQDYLRSVHVEALSGDALVIVECYHRHRLTTWSFA